MSSDDPMSSDHTEISISGGSAEVRIRKVLTGNGVRLEISAPGRGSTIRLDAVELESLTWQTPDTLSELRRSGPGKPHPPQRTGTHMKPHKDRVALVTGAAGFLGAAIARRFAKDGYHLALTDITSCQEVAEELRGLGAASVWAREWDLADLENLDGFVAEADRHFGSVDILVNNAVYVHPLELHELEPKVAESYFRLNTLAPLFLSRGFAAGMATNGWGRIVNIFSTTALRPAPHLIGYTMSKAALMTQTHGLALLWGTDGITVNAISPTWTPHSNIEPHKYNPPTEAIVASQAIKRVGTPEDVVGTISFLASDDAAFMTGQLVLPDGGLVMLG